MTDTPQRKYVFSWNMLGDLEQGRPNLGLRTRLEVYRLMQYSFRDVLEQRYGSDETDRIFYDAGYLAGSEFYKNMIGPQENMNAFIYKLQSVLKELAIGILRVEESDPENGSFVITVSEDLDCSGLPETGLEYCTYDEGFLAALLESYTGKPFAVKEVDCWCVGDRTCRFNASVREE